MPNGRLTYKRGEIWWVDLKPVVGYETDKERPCLILQNDIGNQNGTTTIVAPLLPGKKTYPFVVNITPTVQNGLDGDRHINLSQMRAVDSQRIKNKQGVLEDVYWEEIEKAVCIQLGFSLAFKSS
ncbi:type II toxin-antitoxin system PemK/MazF family toxin [Microcystis aeruginosa]|uniref:mRNA interferase n=2 Tax=Microcystis TaxID=1125 RepID=A0A552E9R7_MICAE|nr:type II toxin-antitoxin system PemK/MazF family toxin [Microcystis aeruginosa]MBE8995819.1 type II toxin-antitoxin system PemK/MazF family toxin [Microcystis aeruginosa LEGE 91341]TRU31225.1 MAG: type II toxin-antitoxin system PemK/MazF family toxin [Microcystis aeruginosa Ma_MB_F_20061100_S20D]TRU36807.1 MAG: type II toxin-antitoxin system PemK/MazF family toxin [Microcystis aeruginosa Ma_MB_F_20061100_S20]